MTYIVLARKWRPMIFDDVIGQEHISKILVNALKNKRVAQAYIFSGPRGIGKTTMARLLAKAVNCENQPTVNPCNQCPTCKSITDGHSLDVIEIDGASNRGIDEIRNLRENIRFSPASARYKIYIIDEVHMLTKEAFNALLKTLEEPPSHAIFIFATTEIHRVPLTILSRCQRFDFKRIAVSKIVKLLKKIAQSENIDINDEALLLIARKAEGSMRDAESILDQMISMGGNKVTVEQIRESLGLIDQEVYFEYTQLLNNLDSSEILKYANKVFSSGHDLIDFLHGLQEHFRNFLLAKALQDTKLLDVSDYYKDKYKKESQKFSEKDLIHYLQIVTDAELRVKFSVFPELEIEMLLLKLAHKPPSVKLEEIITYLEKLKQKKMSPVSPVNKPADTLINGSIQNNYSDTKKRHSYPTPTAEENKLQKKSNLPVTNDTNKGFQNLAGTLEDYQNISKTNITENSNLEKAIQIKLSDIKSKWSNVIEKIRSQKIALGAFLEEGIPYQIEKNKLIIAYDKNASFHQEHVEKNARVIENIVKEEYKQPVKIGFKTIDFQQEGIQKQPRTPEEVLDDIKNKEPIIRKIIDVFDLDESMSKNAE